QLQLRDRAAEHGLATPQVPPAPGTAVAERRIRIVAVPVGARLSPEHHRTDHRRVRVALLEVGTLKATAQLHDFVADVADRSTQIERHLRALHHTGVQRTLEAPVVDLAEVAIVRAREAVARRNRVVGDRPPRPRVEVGELAGEPVVEERDVESRLDLARALRPDQRVAWLARTQARRAARARERNVDELAGERVRLTSRLTPRGPQPHRVDEGHVPEGLLRDHPGERELRVVDQVEVGTERRVVVGAHGGGQEEPIVEAQLLLHVHAERLVLDVIVVHLEIRLRRLVDRCLHGYGEAPPRRLQLLAQPCVVLQADGRRGTDRFREPQPCRRAIVDGLRGYLGCRLDDLAERELTEALVARDERVERGVRVPRLVEAGYQSLREPAAHRVLELDRSGEAVVLTGRLDHRVVFRRMLLEATERLTW